jgi:RNA polymerase sigma-70 factor (ECF subfamily)
MCADQETLARTGRKRGVDTLLDVSELPSDEQLAAQAAREGSDGPAFTALVERFRDRVWRICFRLLGQEDDAQDAAQEVFVRLFMQRAGFRGESRYATWVHAVAVRTCLSLRRSRGRRLRYESAAGAEKRPGPQPASAALQLDLAQMLETLDEEDRAMVILKYAEDYSFEELASIFGLSISACKMRVSRAREKVQRKFGGPESQT